MIVQVRYDVRGRNGPALEQGAMDVLNEFAESPEIWRIAIEAHQADESEWIGHVTVRRKRRLSDDDYDF
jgi:hypothetical protein